MAKPTYYPDWATDDVNLPATGNTNKIRPREVLRTTGWDKGQIPTAEEFNWTLNNNGLWIRYLVDEFVPTLPNTYLPLNGTQVTFSGDLTGTITWSGTAAVTSNIQVVDNSHNHVSSNITDATALPTSNMIAKRASNGAIWTGRAHYVIANDAANADYFLTGNGSDIQASLNYSQSNDTVTLYKGSTTSIQTYIQLNPSNIAITNPRATNAQETSSSSLVRYDYLSSQISALNSTLTNYINGRTEASISGDQGWWRDNNTGVIYQWGTASFSQTSGGENFYVPFNMSFPNNCANIQIVNQEDQPIEGNQWRVRSKTTAGFYFDNQDGNMYTAYMWFAIGN